MFVECFFSLLVALVSACATLYPTKHTHPYTPMLNCCPAIVLHVHGFTIFTSMMQDSENNDLRCRSLAHEKDHSSHLLCTKNYKLPIQSSNFITVSGRAYLAPFCMLFISSLTFFLNVGSL